MIFQKKKHVVEIAGGLGNQMFQYAFYLRFRKIYQDTCIDTSSYINDYIHNGYELDRVFDIKPNYCNSMDLIHLKDINQSLFNKLKRNLIGHRPSIYYEHDKDYSYKPFIFDYKSPVFFQGCWLSEKYFKDIEDEVKSAFSFKPFTNHKNLELKYIIEKRQSVSIHIRRGDYKNNKIYEDICNLSYYKKSIEYIEVRVKSPLFIIFSDEPNFIKDEFTFLASKEYIIVDWNKAENSYKDMQLMSICKHNIIANSTFSWWGAWLNRNTCKIVISPAKWFNSDKFKNEDIIIETWVKIE